MDNKLLEKLEVIEKKLDVLQKRLDSVEVEILKKLDGCETSCKNMDDHINFVENVYTTLRSPLNYVSGLFYNNPKELPQIKD